MATKVKLSKRDKILIYLCSLFVFAAGVYWLAIQPCMNIIAEYEEKNGNAFLDVSDRAEMASMLAIYEDQNKMVHEEYDSLKSVYFEMMDDEEIDRMLTAKVKKYNLKPERLEFADKNQDIPYNYNYTINDIGEEELLEKAAEEQQAAEENGEGIVEETEAYTDVRTESVSMSFSGTINSLKNFIDDVSKESSMRIISISVVPGDESDSIENVGHSAQVLTVEMNIEVYMYVQPE